MRKIIFLNFLLFCAVSGLSLEAFAQNRKSVSAAEVNGSFRSKSGSEFQIWALGNNKLRIQFDGVYSYKVNGEWTAHTGYAGGEADIDGDTAIFVPLNTEGCTIKIKFVRQGLIRVTHEGSDADCGFGQNVTADGDYRKISSKKPKFEAP